MHKVIAFKSMGSRLDKYMKVLLCICHSLFCLFPTNQEYVYKRCLSGQFVFLDITQ